MKRLSNNLSRSFYKGPPNTNQPPAKHTRHKRSYFVKIVLTDAVRNRLIKSASNCDSMEQQPDLSIFLQIFTTGRYNINLISLWATINAWGIHDCWPKFRW